MRFAASVPGLSSFMTKGPDYGKVANLGMEANSFERQALNKAEGLVARAGVDALAKVKTAEHKARQIEAGYAAQASSVPSPVNSFLQGALPGIGGLNFGGGGSSSFNMSTPTSWGTSFPTSLPAGGGYGSGYGSFS